MTTRKIVDCTFRPPGEKGAIKPDDVPCGFEPDLRPPAQEKTKGAAGNTAAKGDGGREAIK